MGHREPQGLHKPKREDRSDQDIEAIRNALVETVMLDAKVLEEGGHGLLLLGRAQKVIREAATGEACCNP